MAATKNRTIAHAIFWYSDPDQPAIERLARRGDTVALLAADVVRGEEHGAFTPEVGDVPLPPTGSVMRGWPEDSEAEQDAWVEVSTDQELLAYAIAYPEYRDAIVAAETRRGTAARAALLDRIATLDDVPADPADVEEAGRAPVAGADTTGTAGDLTVAPHGNAGVDKWKAHAMALGVPEAELADLDRDQIKTLLADRQQA